MSSKDLSPGRVSTVSATETDIPPATIARLPKYLRCLNRMPVSQLTVRSGELARHVGVSADVMRKDFSFLAITGTRGIGYEVDALRERLEVILGADQERRVIIIGAGHLGHALANYGGFSSRGFQVVALFDASSSVVGQEIAGLAVRDIATLPAYIAAHGAEIAVIATPATVAQSNISVVVEAGVKSILNFASIHAIVPPEVSVRNVDLSSELHILAFSR